MGFRVLASMYSFFIRLAILMTNWTKTFEENLPSDTIITAVEGYRIWYVPVDRGTLHSFWMVQQEWKPLQKIEAVCLSHMSCPQESIQSDARVCSAGIHAFKTLDQAYTAYIDQMESLVQISEAAAASGIESPDPHNRIMIGKVYL